MTKKPRSSECDLANHEIVTIAVFTLGGATRPIDTEDIAVKANELAPGRFAWQKYKEQISLDSVRKRLWDARSEEKGFGYLTGSERDGWMLTKKGVEFAEERVRHLDQIDLSGERIKESDKKWRDRERVRLLSSAAFWKTQDGGADTITAQDVAAFFRVDEYVTGATRENKIARIVNAFHDDPELSVAVTILAGLVNGGNSNER